MPVVSPRRSSAAALTGGSYRPSYSSERPLYGYSPRTYTERITERNYLDDDGRRVYYRQGSITTEDGVTTRFREERTDDTPTNYRRDSSMIRDIPVIRESSVCDGLPPRRERSTMSESRPRLSSSDVAESLADMRNRYSPANYVPACWRTRNARDDPQQNGGDGGGGGALVARSRSINDIGRPPPGGADGKHQAARAQVKACDGRRRELNGVAVANLTNGSGESDGGADDDDNDDANGNRTQSVAEIRRMFEEGATGDVVVNGKASAHGKLAEHATIDREGAADVVTRDTDGVSACAKVAVEGLVTPPTIATNEVAVNGEDAVDGTQCRNRKLAAHRTNDFASFIPARDANANDDAATNGGYGGGGGARAIMNYEVIGTGTTEGNNDLDNRNYVNKERNDLSSTPHLNNSRPMTQNMPVTATNATTSNNLPQSRRPYHAGATTTNNNNNNTSSNNVVATLNAPRERHDSDESGSLPVEYARAQTRRTNSNAATGKTCGLNGLKNIGNTCFMNSVVQCLSNTKPLLEYVRKEAFISDINANASNMKGALIKAFSQVIKELWSDDLSDRVVNTIALKSQIQRFAPRFIGYAQQDAQEFLRYLLEGLHEDVNRVTTKPAPIHTEIEETLSDNEKASESWKRYLRMDNSKIVDIFVGQLKSTLKCTHCGHCSVTFDPFWDLSLPIPQRTGQIRLQQCLESFTREETLDGDEKPTCSKCKERRKCTKSFSVQKFPKILVIHLKRFSPTERFRGKLSVTVDFPLEGLDMSDYAAETSSQSCRYNLYAVSNHSGTTYSGHYTAYCRHPYTATWHEYNDSRVSPISSKSIVSGEGYVLFYELDNQKSHL